MTVVRTYLWVLMLCSSAFSWSNVPSALVNVLRFSRGMRTPESCTTGLADARRARATVSPDALQNMVTM